ncbi:MAG: D-alanyl-D-alanine carboxypeptidase/D-alanyl-D-alanine-endopeptidase [Fibrobacteria bacterium]|nr:D-alanyl-D-alanine carboxypeptidase/D-alanyl-D-alanine-endopeptidase [Fibrobacteria bacterium]
MKHFSYSFILFMVLNTIPAVNCFSAETRDPKPGSLLADIKQRLDPSIGGRLGLSIYSTKHNRYEARIADTELYTPASCLKLLVTAACIAHFPKNYFPETHIKLTGQKKGRSLKGNLLIIGQGDPNISARFFSNTESIFKQWIEKIIVLEIDTISGTVMIDDSYFTSPHKPIIWKPRHFNKWYGAEVSALSFNDNCFDVHMKPGEKAYVPIQFGIQPEAGYVNLKNFAVTVPGNKNKLQFILHPDTNLIYVTGTLGINASRLKRTFPVRTPPQYFKSAFETALSHAGIQVLGKESTNQTDSAQYKSFTFTTVPLTNILEEVNQRSQNLHAEILLRHLGASVKKDGSRESGVIAEKIFIHNLGLDSSDFQIVDGSGLSHLNKVTSKGMTDMLAKMVGHKNGTDYIQTLATPGVHGASARRLSHLRGLVKFKTGFINNVQGLCGYIFTGDNDTLSFSIFLNDYSAPDFKAKKSIDTLITFIANWYNKELISIERANRLYKSKDIPEHYLDRLVYFSKKLEGAPYYPGPTGEGRGAKVEPKPLIDLHRFDCVTYIESAMALAMNSSTKTLMPSLNNIRYIDSTVNYQSRKHFFVEDWIKQSPDLVRIFRFPGDTTASRTTDKIKFFKLKNQPPPANNPVTSLSYLPYDKALELMENWSYGKLFLGVGFVTSLDWLWVSHTGFLDATKTGKPKLRHASLKHKKVIAEDFREYLLSRKGKCLGVFFFEFEDKTVF